MLQTFFRICRERNLKISARKTDLFLKSLKWCCRIISPEGVRYEPKNAAGLQNCSPPLKAGELCEYVHCISWMQNGIPNHAQRVAPLRDVLERAYAKAGKRTKRSIQNIPLNAIGWAQVHNDAFRDLQDTLRENINLAHRNTSLSLCVFTDASDRFWASVVTQCDEHQLNLSVPEQEYQPLSFLSGEFTGAQIGWTTFEKEGFAILQTFSRLDYMLQCETAIRIFTDHRNLLFVFCPTLLDPSLGRHKVMKVQRWAIYLSQFSYQIKHVDGCNNVMPDIMTRWLRGYRGNKGTVKRVSHLLLESDIVESPMSQDFDWPSIDDVRTAQQQFRTTAPQNTNVDESGAIWTKGKRWIPDDAEHLQLRLLITAHCGTMGHRGAESTAAILHEKYKWKSIDADAKAFVANCIHCIMAKTGRKIPRPLSSTLHATLPNEVVHCDYLFMGPSQTDMRYILVIKDDLSSYTWLIPCASADAETASKGISRWIRSFTAMDHWVSDQSTRFKNEIMEILAKDYCGIVKGRQASDWNGFGMEMRRVPVYAS